MNDPLDAMRKTIVARIATRDTSVPNPTPEQIAETERLLNLVMEAIGDKHPDFPLMQKLASGLVAPKEAVKGEPVANSPEEGSPAELTPGGNNTGTTQDDVKGGDTMPPPPPVIYPERDVREPPKQSWTAAAMDYLIKTEKFSPEAYPDPGGEKWAVGYGNQLHPGQKVRVKPGDTVAKGRAREYMADAMMYNVGKLQASVGEKQWSGMTGGQKLALTSWAYNVGETNVRGSDLAKRMKKGEAPADVIRQELPRWHNEGKAKARRAEEAAFAASSQYE